MFVTTPSNEIEDAIDFMHQVAATPDAVRERQGASDDDIQRFIELAQHPLPYLYIGYLRQFGTNAGPLSLAPDTNLKRLINHYIDRSIHARPVRDGVLLSAVSAVEGPYMLRYSEAAKRGTEEPTVVISGDVDRMLATNFRCALYQNIIYSRPLDLPLLMRLERFPKEDTFDREREANMAEVARAAQDLGFQGYWFNDACVGWFERDDGSVLYVDTLDFSVFARGHFNTPDARDWVQEYLTECVGLLPAK